MTLGMIIIYQLSHLSVEADAAILCKNLCLNCESDPVILKFSFVLGPENGAN